MLTQDITRGKWKAGHGLSCPLQITVWEKSHFNFKKRSNILNQRNHTPSFLTLITKTASHFNEFPSEQTDLTELK